MSSSLSTTINTPTLKYEQPTGLYVPLSCFFPGNEVDCTN